MNDLISEELAVHHSREPVARLLTIRGDRENDNLAFFLSIYNGERKALDLGLSRVRRAWSAAAREPGDQVERCAYRFTKAPAASLAFAFVVSHLV